MNKKLIILFLFLSSVNFAQNFIKAEARGLFMSLGVGVRIPIADLSDRYNPGSGIDVGFSYTDNRVIPVFLYAKFGYYHLPGSQDFYRNSDYSEISDNVFSIQPGIRFFYPPVIKNVVILMPVMDVGLTYTNISTLHQFKLDSGKRNFEESRSKFGFHIGGGLSMFLIDVLVNYNYVQNNQFVSFEFKCRIPIFASI